jgi:AraC-like DNA-binding protein
MTTTLPRAGVLIFTERLSESPFVERIWRSHSAHDGSFLSVAQSHFEMAVTRHQGRTFITLRGPETIATRAECPAEGEWLGIRFALGTFMPGLMPRELRDRRDATLPAATARSFWLDGSTWEYPTFENADTFVARLAQKGLLARDFVVDAILRGHRARLPLRSAQRHFLHATGITHRSLLTIERARRAAVLLREGVSILDTVHETGYFDQAHLTRALGTLIGTTPAELRRGTQQLSFLYKTSPLPPHYAAHGRTTKHGSGTNDHRA